MKRTLLLITCCTILLASCQFTGAPAATTQAPTPVSTEPIVVEPTPLTAIDPNLTGQVWYWRAFLSNDDIHHTLVDFSENYTIEFLEDGSVTIQADCNRAGTHFIQQDSSLDFDEIEMTAQYCGDDSLDTLLIGYLTDVVTYVMEDDVLHLNLKMDAGNMVFTQAVDTPLPLLADLQPDGLSHVGPVWYWQAFQSMSDEIGRSVIADPENYTFQLNPDGTAQIQADCNSGFSSYTSDGSSLTFGSIALTKMACPAGSLENKFVSNLEYVVTYVFEDGLLYLNLAIDAGDMIFSTTPEPIALPFE